MVEYSVGFDAIETLVHSFDFGNRVMQVSFRTMERAIFETLPILEGLRTVDSSVVRDVNDARYFVLQLSAQLELLKAKLKDIP